MYLYKEMFEVNYNKGFFHSTIQYASKHNHYQLSTHPGIGFVLHMCTTVVFLFQYVIEKKKIIRHPKPMKKSIINLKS